MMRALTFVAILSAWLCPTPTAHGGARDGRLDIHWIDVEGGAATLIITSVGESILIDTGWPGERDARRIANTAAAAGIKAIDHLVITHYDIDHFGGAADLAKLLPIHSLYDNGHVADSPQQPDKAYLELAGRVEKRLTLSPGDIIPLTPGPNGSPPLQIRCLAARKQFITAPADAPRTDGCQDAQRKAEEKSDNANSIVLLLSFGRFRFYDGADLTWNLEERLVCPVNLIGPVDVYQVTHHGLDSSNNLLVIQAVRPTVAVNNNGARKGGSPLVYELLKSTPSVQAIYQLHKAEVRNAVNPPDEYIANHQAACEGTGIMLSVAADSASYTVIVPSTGHHRTFQTKAE